MQNHQLQANNEMWRMLNIPMTHAWIVVSGKIDNADTTNVFSAKKSKLDLDITFSSKYAWK